MKIPLLITYIHIYHTYYTLYFRFYDVNSGSVTIDNIDIREFDCRWLRGRALGLISQEPVLFATTVKENIRYGKPEATDAEVSQHYSSIFHF